MNLLLYIEARQTIARQERATADAGSSIYWIGDRLPALPDSLFEELGYFGVTEEGESDPDGELNELFHWFAEPALSYAA